MAEDPKAIYRRHPIRRDSRDSRVIHLLPGSGSEEIRGELHNLCLDDAFNEPYEALSYVWGDPSITKPIVVDGQEIQVTTNLEAALRHIRKPDGTVIIWVDAVCINQDDNAEKSHQVSMMYDIYKKCSQVYIWLGYPADPAVVKTNPYAFLAHFENNRHFHELPGYFRDKTTGKLAFQEDEAFMSMWESFCLIANSSWWTRAWTVQETIFPLNTTVMYGYWKTSWYRIVCAGYRRNSHMDSPTKCCSEALEIFPKPRRIFFNLFMSDVMFVNGPREAHTRGSQDSFHELVRSFACRDCKDPRDKIFSLLALANTVKYADLKPNYSKNVAEVYTETFCSMLDETDGDFRCLLGHGFGDLGRGLPSWIRDFSVVVPRDVVVSDIRRLSTYRLYNTSDGIPGNLVCIAYKELHLSGFVADTVQTVGPAVRTVESDDLKAIFSQWLELVSSVLGSADKSTARGLLARLMCADVINDPQAVSQTGMHWRRALDIDIPEKQIWQQFLDGDKWALERAYRGGMEAAINGRAFFVTKNGRMGLCSLGVMPGDQVWVVFGSLVPFVLRPRQGNGGQSTHYPYGFVSDCYLQGIMDGEATIKRNISAKASSVIII